MAKRTLNKRRGQVTRKHGNQRGRLLRSGGRSFPAGWMVRTLAATAGGLGSPSAQGTKISHGFWCAQNIFKKWWAVLWTFFFVFFLLALFGYGVRMIKYKLKNPTEVNGTMKSYYKVKLLLNIAYYKQCCDEHWGTCVSFSSGFLCVYAQLLTAGSRLSFIYFVLPNGNMFHDNRECVLFT